MTDPAVLIQRTPTVEADRRQEILNIAATLFAKRGFSSVSVREIADAAGIMGGSLYHHFKSKEALYLEIHAAALIAAERDIRAAIAPLTDPWERLEAACAKHLEIQIDPYSVTLPLMNDLFKASGELRQDLVRQRDLFEEVYRELVAALPLRHGIDRDVYRLSLLSLINSVPTWFHSGRLTLAQVASQILTIFRHPLG